MRAVIRVGLLALNIGLLFLLLQSCGCRTNYPSSEYRKIDVDGKISYLLRAEIVPFTEEDYENVEIALDIVQQIDPTQGGWTFRPACFWFSSKKYSGLTLRVDRDVTERIVFINKDHKITSINYFLGNFIELGSTLSHEFLHANAGVPDNRCGELTDKRIMGILSTNIIEVDFDGYIWKVGRTK